ncbi:MAG: hypothetical protein LBI41_05200 [Lactobacillales bacterium]|jgi:hypothetical protein|nr:hypothetical protein [Lactobacillales bacterium]
MKKAIKFITPYGFIFLYRIIKKRKVEMSEGFAWAMTKNERKLFIKYIKGSKIYLEFGSGGSTISSIKNKVTKIYSVESSKDWINAMKNRYNLINIAQNNNQLKYIYADIGPCGAWGMPLEKSDKMLNYSEKIFEKYNDVKFADVILIDGRFRVTCCLCALKNVSDDTVIMIHDFWNRPYYHIIKKYVNIMDGVDSLMICKKKFDINFKELENDLKHYNYNAL